MTLGQGDKISKKFGWIPIALKNYFCLEWGGNDNGVPQRAKKYRPCGVWRGELKFQTKMGYAN